MRDLYENIVSKKYVNVKRKNRSMLYYNVLMYIFVHIVLLYNNYVAAPIWQRKGGGFIESYYFFFSRCRGWCSLPLHHQMVRQR